MLTLLGLSFLAALLGLTTAATAEDIVSRPVDFARDIRPILAGSCLSCHDSSEPQGQLRLTSQVAALKGGFSGPAIVPGKPDESLLYQRITATDVDERMPHDDEPLPPESVALVRAWIEQGATWPKDEQASSEIVETHWAYVKPVRPRPPAVAHREWVRKPIDAFVLARLEQEGIEPSPEATKEQLIRRVYLDLIGLPPTLSEVDAFLADASEDAYEKVVDRLLTSPHYGERWAQPWLDAARYADSNGFTNDRKRSIWPYRDWVVAALNADMPFDQFTIEQIAGDLLPAHPQGGSATTARHVATGFHRNTMFNDEQGVDQGEARWNALVDRVSTTATVWLGTTLACCQCHNHKYDPFSQRDFYGLLAFFENIDFTYQGEAHDKKYIEPLLDLAPPEIHERRKALETQIAERKKMATAMPGAAANQANTAQPTGGQPQPAVPTTKDEIDRLVRELDALVAAYPQTMVVRDRPSAGTSKTHLRIKGSYLSVGEEVLAGVPAALHPLPPGGPRNRLALARWLVDPANPLTARVIVNRNWSQFFGRGLVETEEDFGSRGARPTHPELLDWLATEFELSGWRMKHVHRTIVLSSTYRQSSTVTPALWERDPQNRLLARGGRFRLSGEAVRDTQLAVSGLLSNKMGGPSVFPPQPVLSALQDHGDFVWTESQGEDRFRRSLYTFWRRSALHPALSTFDAPSRESCTVKRIRSNTPLQALVLLNDQTAYEAAIALAKRICAEAATDDPRERAAYAFRLCTCRRPSTKELDTLVEFYDAARLQMEQDPTATQQLAEAAGLPAADSNFAVWFLLSQALLNLDETLTKE